MKRSLAFLVVVLFIPPLTAYAVSVTSKSFVVRNWKAQIPSSDDEEDPADTFIPPDPAAPPALADLAPTTFISEVEQGEEIGQDEEIELGDEDSGKPGEIEKSEKDEADAAVEDRGGDVTLPEESDDTYAADILPEGAEVEPPTEKAMTEEETAIVTAEEEAGQEPEEEALLTSVRGLCELT